MIYLKSIINVIDNSGAKLAECIHVFGKGFKRPGKIGDKITVVVKKTGVNRQSSKSASSSASATVVGSTKVKRGDIKHAVIVRTLKERLRPDGSYIKFGDNACVLINDNGDPLGTRIHGIVARELLSKGYSKIVQMAPRAM